MTKFMKQFIAARNVSTPLIAVKTVDPAATIQSIVKTVKEQESAGETVFPFFQWDICNGLTGIDDVSKAALANISSELPIAPSDTLIFAKQLPAESIIFMHNMQRFLDGANEVQAIWNLRDIFKQNFRTLVMLVNEINLPAELAQDVLVLDEPLPTNEELAEIARSVYRSAQLDEPKQDIVDKIVDATCGLAAFTAEQCIAMSLTENGVNLDDLWERKRKVIENIRGLSVYRGGEKFCDITGLDNLKNFYTLRGKGPKKPRGIVFIDEIDKHTANFGATGTGDTTTEMIGPLLTDMEDSDAEGVLAVGVPGTGKSLVAKAVGNEYGCPTIIFDFSGMKASHVGESGANIRAALKVVKAMTQGNVLYIATCNRIANLPPELRRRFNDATFFFDLPSEEEKKATWKLYIKKFSLDAKQKLPNDGSWTQAEIRNCCQLAYKLSCSLVEAATYIVPVAKSSAEQITNLRKEANGRYISVSAPGYFQYDETAPVQTGRAIRVSQ